jgi:hypothetical protein
VVTASFLRLSTATVPAGATTGKIEVTTERCSAAVHFMCGLDWHLGWSPIEPLGKKGRK